MGNQTRISAHLQAYLKSKAKPGETPNDTIGRLLPGYKAPPALHHNKNTLIITYKPKDREKFINKLLIAKRCFVRINFEDGTHVIKEWNAKNFKASSNLLQNLYSGILRGWSQRGIVSAELAITKSKLTD